MAQQDIVAAVSATLADTVSESIDQYAVSRVAAGDGIAVSGTNDDVDGSFGVVQVENTGVLALKSGPGATVYAPAAGVEATNAAPAAGTVRIASRSPRIPRLNFVSPSSAAFAGKWYDVAGDLYAPLDTVSKESLVVSMDPLSNMTLPEMSVDLEVVIRFRVNSSAGTETTRTQQVSFQQFSLGQNSLSPAATVNKTFSLLWGSPNKWQQAVLRLVAPADFTPASRSIVRMSVPPIFTVVGESYTNEYLPLIIHDITYDLVPTSLSD